MGEEKEQKQYRSYLRNHKMKNVIHHPKLGYNSLLRGAKVELYLNNEMLQTKK